jgi:hypothetical protein
MVAGPAGMQGRRRAGKFWEPPNSSTKKNKITAKMQGSARIKGVTKVQGTEPDRLTGASDLNERDKALQAEE